MLIKRVADLSHPLLVSRQFENFNRRKVFLGATRRMPQRRQQLAADKHRYIVLAAVQKGGSLAHSQPAWKTAQIQQLAHMNRNQMDFWPLPWLGGQRCRHPFIDGSIHKSWRNNKPES